MERQYSNLRAVFHSMYSKELYRDIKQRWHGLGAGYLLFMLIIVVLIQSFIISYHMKDANRAMTKAWQQMPAITIQHGVATANNQEKMTVKAADGKVLMVVDTKITKPNRDSAAKVFVTKEGVYTKNKHGELDFRSYPKSKKAVLFNPGDMGLKLGRDFSIVMALVMFPIGVAISFFVSFIFAAIASLIMKLLALTMSVKISCSEAMRLSVVALTPAFLFGIVLNLFKIEYHHMLLVWLLINIFYVTFALCANRQK